MLDCRYVTITHMIIRIEEASCVLLYAKVSKNGEGAPDEDSESNVCSHDWTTSISIPAQIHHMPVGVHITRTEVV
jgi:hypothetical protein